MIPSEGNLDELSYIILFTLRISLTTGVHYIYCVWLYSLATLRKWTVNDYGVLFYILVFTFLSLHFISNSIHKVFFSSAYSAIINLDRFHVERTIIDLVIAKVMFSVIPGRLAKIEMIESKVNILNILNTKVL